MVYKKTDVYKYTEPWFDRIEEDSREWSESESEPMTQEFYKYLEREQFDFLRHDAAFLQLKE